MEISINPMKAEDIDELYPIELSAQVVPWMRTTFENCVAAGYACWVMREGSAMIGYILTYVRAGECHILNFCIKPDKQRQGLGEKLLIYALNYAKQLGADTTILEVRVSNQSAIRLYHRLGFNAIGKRKDYYAKPDGGREDALVWALDMTVQE